jgi:hypothetical protein
MCKAVFPSSVAASNNSSRFSSTSLVKLHNVSNASYLTKSAARCHAMYPVFALASNNFLYSVAILLPGPTVSAIFLYGFPVLPSARELILPQLWLATIHLGLVPLP